MKVKKYRPYLIEDFQEFGEIIFIPLIRLTENVEGNKLSEPIWEGMIVDAKDKRLRDIWYYRLKNDLVPFLVLSFESKLKELLIF